MQGFASMINLFLMARIVGFKIKVFLEISNLPEKQIHVSQ